MDHQQDDHLHHRHRIRHCDREPVRAISNGGQDFTAWFRALPLTYTDAFAGYQAGGGRWFRYVATTVTILPPAQPAGNGGTAAISLGHDGGPTPRPYARIEIRSGGGPGSVRYDTSTGTGTFTLSPQPGDQVALSIYYDQHGRNYLGLTLLNRGTSQTITNPASPLIASMPYNNAWIAAMIDNTAVTPPLADTRIWAFTGSRITAYNGDRGTILGPWATSEYSPTPPPAPPRATIVMNAAGALERRARTSASGYGTSKPKPAATAAEMADDRPATILR